MATRLPNSSAPVSTQHIVLDEQGNARLAGSRIKVQHIVGIKQAHGYTPEQIQTDAYPHLTLSQIYAALAYYYDHQTEIDAIMRCEEKEYQEAWQKQNQDLKHQAFVAELRRRWEQK